MRGIEQFLQVDAATLGALKYAGTWNASTNTPTLASGVGVQGQYYVVSVAGSTNLDGETAWQVGDWAVFNGSVWQKVDGGSTGLLTTLTVTGNTFLATTSGDVGIGTASPVAKLTVSGTAGNGNGLMSVDGSDFVRIFADSSFGSAINWSTGDSLRFATSDSSFGSFTECVRITAAGDVGINTSSPAYKLDVLIGAGSGSLFRAGQSGVSNGYTITSNGSALTHFWATTGEAMRLDASGNLGLAVTPSAWVNYRALQVGALANLSYNAGFSIFGSNAFFNGTNWIYQSTNRALDYYQDVGNGNHVWRIAASGTAGNAISFTQDMTLNSTGLGIGTTSPSVRLQLEQAANSAPVTLLRLNNSGTTGGGPGIASRISFTAGATALGYVQGSNFASGAAGLQFSGDGTNAQATLDASGNLGLAVTPSAWGSSFKALDIGSQAGVYAQGALMAVASNVYVNPSAQSIYKTSTSAGKYEINGNSHAFFTAPSGTAGDAISFTQDMTLNSTGLSVGTTSTLLAQAGRGNITLNGSSDAVLAFGNGGASSGYVYSSSAKLELDAAGARFIQFNTNGNERARIPSAGGMVVGTAALATTATDGFLYVPTCAGTPTGTPTTQTGTAPIVIDTTNNKLYFYSGGQWRDAGP